MIDSVIGRRMQNYDLIGGPLADGALWRGALFWALALYIPLSGPLGRLEDSLGNSSIKDQWRQLILVTSSLLVALVTGLITQFALTWTLGPGWGSSLAIIGIGWSLLLGLSNQRD